MKNFWSATYYLSSFLVALLGSLVIIGWLNDYIFLIKIHPNFTPMQFNTALCFALLGLSLIFIRFKVTYFLLTTTFIIAFGTLIQWITGVDFGLDQFFITTQFGNNELFPGRMVPNSAVSFSLISIFLLLFKINNNYFTSRLMVAASFFACV